MLYQRLLITGVLLFILSYVFAQAPRLRVEGKVKIDGERLEFSDEVNANIFIGHGVDTLDDGGVLNTIIGNNAFQTNSSGVVNTVVGVSGMEKNISGSRNVAVGNGAINKNTSGGQNVAVGVSALRDNTQGENNTAIGFQALNNNSTGNRNVAVGYNALKENFTGINNTAVGYSAFSNQQFFANSTALGYNTAITASNQIRLGDVNVSSIGGYEPWTNLSDQRLKKNIKENISGLEFITQLRPVSYQLDMENIADWHKTPDSLRDHKSEAVKGNIRYSGFLAQEVEATAQAIGYEFSGVDAPKNEGDRYGLRYSQFVVPLVKAVQELEEERQAATARIENLERELATLKALVIGDKQTIELRSNHKTTKLAQNTPNPFTGSTMIDYFIPDGFRQAVIRIADHNGKLVKDVEIYQSGAGQIELNADQLNNGNYFYYLILDGQLVESRQMVKLNDE